MKEKFGLIRRLIPLKKGLPVLFGRRQKRWSRRIIVIVLKEMDFYRKSYICGFAQGGFLHLGEQAWKKG